MCAANPSVTPRWNRSSTSTSLNLTAAFASLSLLPSMFTSSGLDASIKRSSSVKGHALHAHHIHTVQLPLWRDGWTALLYEGMTHVMPACRMDLWSAQLWSVPMLYINGPSAFPGSPEYTQ